jgi:hemoglobin
MKTRFAKQRLMKTLKAEEVNGKAYKPIEEARGNIGIFIDQIYNRRRLHSAIRYQPPVEFEAEFRQHGGHLCIGGTTMINNSQRSLRALTMLAAALVVFAALPGRTANAVDTKSLYERLGGYDGISAVVDEFADSLFADKRINEFFIGMSDDTRAQFKQKNKNLLCNATGGPCKVISRPAKEAHHGLGITAADFEVVAGHLKDVLNKDKVGPKEQEEVFAIILGLRSQIVDRPDETRLSRDAAAQR